jgi:parallel beta-helix repeat protein
MSRQVKIFCVVMLVVGLGAAYGVYHVLVQRAARIPGPPKPGAERFYDPERLRAAEELTKERQRFFALKKLADEDPAKAIAPLRDLLAERPDVHYADEVRLELAIALGRCGQREEAMTLLGDVIARNSGRSRPADRARLLMAGLIASCSVDDALREPTPEDIRAEKLLAEAAKSPHDDIQKTAWLQIGMFHLVHGKFRSAIDMFGKIDSEFPGYSVATQGTARAIDLDYERLLEKKDWGGIVAWADEMATYVGGIDALAARRRHYEFRKAHAMRMQGRFAEARVLLEQLANKPGVQNDKDIDCAAELAEIDKAELARGILRTPAVFLEAAAAGKDKRAHFGDDIAADATWGAGRSPLVLTSMVTVKPGATLTIEPGVVVQCLVGTGLVVEGALVAVGTPAKPVRITSAITDPTARSFYDGAGITLAEGCDLDKTQLEHLLIEYQRIGFFSQVDGLTLRRCTFARNGVVGLAIEKDDGATVEDCTFEANAGVGLRSTRSNIVVRGNRVTGNGGYGIEITGRVKATVEANRIEKNGAVEDAAGLFCGNDLAATIRGNAVAANKGHGIFLNGRVEPLVQGNHILNNTGFGIQMERDTIATVEGNLIKGNGKGGLYVNRSAGVIRGNIIERNTEVGIQCAADAAPKITGNRICNNDGNGVRYDPGSTVDLTRNTIMGHRYSQVVNLTDGAIKAPNNYFGEVSKKELKRYIQGAGGGEVEVEPRLPEAPPAPSVPELKDVPAASE